MSRGPDGNWFCFLTLLHFASICTISTQNVIIIFVTFRVDLANAKCDKKSKCNNCYIVTFCVVSMQPKV